MSSALGGDRDGGGTGGARSFPDDGDPRLNYGDGFQVCAPVTSGAATWLTFA